MPQYIRSKTPGSLYFFTVVTFGRHQFLTSPLARRILRQTWRDVQNKHPFDEADFERHFDYIHFNPVKHGHVSRPQDWRWTSFHRYRRLGYYEAGWGCTELGFDREECIW